MSEQGSRLETITALLASLNEWQQRRGPVAPVDPTRKDSGEASARIEELKRQLAAAGAVYHWDGRRYVLDTVATSGAGAQGPDTTGRP